MAAIHISRAVEWRLRAVKPTPSEQQMLSLGGINHDVTKKYHTWRFSCLLLATFFVWLDAAFAVVGLLEFIENAHYFNPVGISAFALEYIAELVLAASVSVSLYVCTQNPRASVSVVCYGWIVSTVAPLLPLFIPLEYLLAKELRGEYLTSSGGYSFPSTIAVVYGVYLLPVLLTIPCGLSRGAMRVRGLLRQGSLAGWCAVASSFIYPLAALGTLALLAQVPIDFTLVAGMMLFILTPLCFVVRRQAFTKPCLLDSDMHGISTTMNALGIFQLMGLVLILVWTVQAAGQGAIEVLQFSCAFVARLLVATLVCAELVLDLVVSNATDMKDVFETHVLEQSLDMLELFEDHSLSSRDSHSAGMPNSIVVNLAGVEALQNDNKVVERHVNDSNRKLPRGRFQNTHLFQTNKARFPEEVQQPVASSSICPRRNNSIDDRIVPKTALMFPTYEAEEHYSKVSAPYSKAGAFHSDGVKRLFLGNSTSFAERGAQGIVQDRAQALAGNEPVTESDGAGLLSHLVSHNESDMQAPRQNRTDLSKVVLQTAQTLPRFEGEKPCIELPVRDEVAASAQRDSDGIESKEQHHPEENRKQSRLAPENAHLNDGGICVGQSLHVAAPQTMHTSDDDPVPNALAIEDYTSIASSTEHTSDISFGNGPDAPAFSCAQGASDPRKDRGIDP